MMRSIALACVLLAGAALELTPISLGDDKDIPCYVAGDTSLPAVIVIQVVVRVVIFARCAARRRALRDALWTRL